MRRVLLLFAALAAFAAAGAQPAGRAEHGPDRETFVYAVRDGDSLRLDRYPALSSAAGPRPCMIFLFGGGFLTGTRDNRRFLPYFRHFTARGCDVVSIDYRLGMKRALDAGPINGERFPGVLASTLAMATEDLRDATAFVCRRAAEWGVDPQRILTSGSCRGHDGPDGRIRPLQRRFRLCTSPPGRVPVCRGNRLCRSRVRSVGRTAVGDVSRAAAALPRRRRPECALRHRSGSRRRRAVRLGRRRPRPRAARRAVLVRLRGRRRPFDGLAADARTLRRDRRRFETRIVPPDAPERPAAFAIDDYLDANYGHYVPGKKRQPSETFRKGYRQ